jgi:hypothetical protein
VTPLYQSRQFSWVMLITFALMLGAIAILSLGEAEGGAPWWVYPFMLAVPLVFGVMTVTVTYETLEIRCLLGFPRRRIPIARIRSCATFRGRWFAALDAGVHPNRGEFRMNGRRGIVVTLDAGLPVTVSAPDPDELLRAVEKARAHLPKHGGA